MSFLRLPSYQALASGLARSMIPALPFHQVTSHGLLVSLASMSR